MEVRIPFQIQELDEEGCIVQNWSLTLYFLERTVDQKEEGLEMKFHPGLEMRARLACSIFPRPKPP